jgi:hypothetical protein
VKLAFFAKVTVSLKTTGSSNVPASFVSIIILLNIK